MAIVSKDDDPAEDLTWVRFGSAPLIVTLVLPLVIGVILLFKCILNHCCVRKSTAKDEMYGVEGRMTILINSETPFVPTTTTTNPLSPPPSSSTSIPSSSSQQQQVKKPARNNYSSDARSSGESNRSSSSSKESKVNNNNVSSNGNSSPVPSSSSPAGTAATTILVTTAESTHQQQPMSNESYEIVDLSDNNVKSSTLHRQLPDLPQPPNHHHHLEGPNPPRRSSSLLSHDGTSELYATVGEVPNPDDLPKSSGAYDAKKFKEKGGGTSKGPQPGTSKGTKGEPSSDSETYGNNAVHHPYAKLKRNVAEHPYARVRSGSTGTGGDEETDTDNYDTPQPYAQTGASVAARLAQAGASSSSSSRSRHHDHHRQGASRDVVDGSANVSSSANAETASGNPVPPRRMGRGWRRGSHPPAQAYDNQAQQHFSGDSQDSRGYTSISVREPLSNIVPNRRPPGQRNYDSHYATVSDDSEEMYAAIEDAEGNYMRIPGEDGDPLRHWHGPNIASPIPERREANSPLPPPPVPPLASPPELSPTGPLVASDPSQATTPTPVAAASTPPLYAQVTKKTKKPKAPLTPTSSAGPSVSSSSQQLIDKKPVSATSSLPAASPQLSTSSSIHSSSAAVVKTRSSDKAAALLSPTNESSEPRRWSKADISYSEFEVVREPLYSISARKKVNSSSTSSASTSQQQKPQSSTTRKPIPAAEVVDEDNYNVIPEDRGLPRSSRAGSSSNNNVPPPPRIHHPPPHHQNNNYQEIGELEISNPYQEIQPKESSSDYYQEIGAGDNNMNGLDSNNLYQEIDKKVPSSSSATSRHENVELVVDDEDDPADQFYETVKPAAAKAKQVAALATASATKTQHLPSPSHSQGSVTSLDRKHGYEKLKKKAGSPTVVVIASDDDDDEDDDTKNEDSLYERVKYPPYERLKESRDDLRSTDTDDLPLDSHIETDDRFYEDIGYSRVKPKKSQQQQTESRTAAAKTEEEQQQSTSSKTAAIENDEEPNNLDQLYARVDKTKKKRNNNNTKLEPVATTSASTTAINAVITTTSHLHHHQQQQHPPPPRLEIRHHHEEITQTCIVLRTDTDGDDDESIEYI